MSFRLFVTATVTCALLVPTSACRPARDTQHTQEGKYSIVRLLKVSRTRSDYLATKMKGATDGLSFLIFVGRQPSVDGRFNLKELRDFRVGSKSYREISSTTLDQPIEPITVLLDTPHLVDAFRDVAGDIPTGYPTATSLVVTIGGTDLTEGAQAEATVYVWADRRGF
jgi:hypothetical protein